MLSSGYSLTFTNDFISGFEYRLRELCKDLLGPVHYSAGSQWESTVVVSADISVNKEVPLYIKRLISFDNIEKTIAKAENPVCNLPLEMLLWGNFIELLNQKLVTEAIFQCVDKSGSKIQWEFSLDLNTINSG